MALGAALVLATVWFLLGNPVMAPHAIIAAFPHSAAVAQDPEKKGSLRAEQNSTATLIAWVGEPPQGGVEEFKKAGMQTVQPHILTAEERTTVTAALASLSTLDTRVPKEHLHTVAFVVGVPGEGTGLTSPAEKAGLYAITLRASVIEEPLTTLLTNKGRRVCTEDGSGVTIAVAGTGTNALTYVLLHESTHVLDISCGITADSSSRFVQDIWTSHSTLAPSLAVLALKTYFRDGNPLPVAKASSLYDALAQTLFVSVYAT